jgi:4,5-DOPA dioxygenase extradiol
MMGSATSTSAQAVFIGHGPPIYALRENPFTPTWEAYFKDVPKPKAILVISAHWEGSGLAVTASEMPRTIHDYDLPIDTPVDLSAVLPGGFGEEFFQVQYAAPGSPALCARVQSVLAPEKVDLDMEWGFDHGAWAPLKHIFPQHDVPVVQMRIDTNRTAAQ